MIEVVTSTGIKVDYTVRAESKEQLYSWLQELYLEYPVSGFATSHSDPQKETSGRWVTYVSRFAETHMGFVPRTVARAV